MKKSIVFISTLVILLMILPGCSFSSPSTNSNDAPSSTPSATDTKPGTGTQSISISSFAFSPKELTINKGDTVTWTNEDSVVHNVVGGIFNSKDLTKGQSFSYVFTETGSFDYLCTYHPSMKGKIIVK